MGPVRVFKMRNDELGGFIEVSLFNVTVHLKGFYKREYRNSLQSTKLVKCF